MARSPCRHVVAFSGILFTIFASTQATPYQTTTRTLLPTMPCSLPRSQPCSTGHLAASVTPLSELERARLVRISFWRRRRRRRQRRLWFSLFSLNDFHLFCRWLLLFFSTPAFSFFFPASPARPAALAEAAGVAPAKCNCHKVSLADVVAGVAAAAFVAAVGCGEST